MDQVQIKIRDIQHFLYCPHRWGLLHIDCAWVENYFVVKTNLLHDRVHDAKKAYAIRNKEVLTASWVYNDTYGIYGVVDCIELTKDRNGVQVSDKDGTYHLTIVEYKPTAPKQDSFHLEDAIQVYAQKLCVDRIFSCNCTCVLYYADKKKRVTLPFDTEAEKYQRILEDTLNDMRIHMDKSMIPAIHKEQNCSGCSMKDVCIPIKKAKKPVKQQIMEVIHHA